MQQIDLVYKLKGKQQSVAFQVAENWNELPISALQYIAEHWMQWKDISAANISLIKVKCALFMRMIPGTKSSVKQIVNVLKNAPSESLYDLAMQASFVIETNNLTVNPLPVIEVSGHKYYGPSNKLTNINAFEFSFAESQYLAYHQTGKIEALNNLIAILYRPQGNLEQGETRVPFNNKLIEKYADHISKISHNQKQMILLWYIGCRNHIVESNKKVFNNENTKQAENTTWIDVIMAISGTKFGTFNETGSMEFHLILKELNHLAKLKEKE